MPFFTSLKEKVSNLVKNPFKSLPHFIVPSAFAAFRASVAENPGMNQQAKIVIPLMLSVAAAAETVALGKNIEDLKREPTTARVLKLLGTVSLGTGAALGAYNNSAKLSQTDSSIPETAPAILFTVGFSLYAVSHLLDTCIKKIEKAMHTVATIDNTTLATLVAVGLVAGISTPEVLVAATAVSVVRAGRILFFEVAPSIKSNSATVDAGTPLLDTPHRSQSDSATPALNNV